MSGNQKLFSVTALVMRGARWFSIFITGVLTLALGAIVLALAALLIAPGLLKVFSIPMMVEGVPLDIILAAALFLVGGSLAGTVLILVAIRATEAIVATAIAGDPFVSDNAERLKTIGWCLLGIMVSEFLTGTMVAWIAPDNNIAGHIDGGDSPSLTGCLAVLLIFVLARIFKHGAQMRDELAGTV